MSYKIIVDSCADLTPEMADEFEITTVPLHLRLGQKEFMDDNNLDLNQFMQLMADCKEGAGSAAPSPASFADAMTDDGFVVTISSELSATYQSASLGADDAPANVHVFDSKSASAGQTLIAVKLRELIANKLPKPQIIDSVNKFIDDMKTYFVIEKFDNLVKNGRMSALKGKIASVLNMKLLLGSDGAGKISLHAKARNTKQMLEKMVGFITESGRKTTGENLVISHVNNQSLAEQLASMVRERFDFKKIFIVPTRGTSTLYANDQGIIVAF